MSRCRVRLLVAFACVVLATTPRALGDYPEPAVVALRDAVLNADSGKAAGNAYKAYFTRLGRSGLKNLMTDANTGIALQAAWETHRKPAQRKEKVSGRADNVYDPAELGKFIAFLKERTMAPVPDWWAAAMTSIDLFPRHHHAFFGEWEVAREGPKGAKADETKLRVEEKGDKFVCTAAGRTVEFPTDTFDGLSTGAFVGSLGEKRSVIAAYTGISGFAYEVAGFEGKGGKPTWKARVRAAGRTELAGSGYHRVEMTEKDGTVYLFGMESHGAYVEAFDAATGKVQFRFCTCYWFNHSESWGLK